MVDDGSGEAHVYVEGDLLRELLMVPSSDWAHLCELVRSLGTLTYTKPIRQVPTDTVYTVTLLRMSLHCSCSLLSVLS